MDLELFAVCESIAVDAETGRLSMFNVIEAIFEPTPLTVPLMHAAAVLRVNEEDAKTDWQVTLRVSGPEMKPIDFHHNFKVKKGTGRHRVVQRIEGMPISADGEHHFEILVNGKHLASHWIAVNPPLPSV